MKKIFILLFIFVLNLPLAAMEPEDGCRSRITPKPQKILLSLDGGGTRAIGSVQILKDIFKGLETNLGRKIEPVEVIDLIGGTSAGGFIAIMLASGKSLEDCFDLFMKHSSAIFSAGWWRWIKTGNGYFRAKYNPKALEDILKDVFKDTLLSDVLIPVFTTTYVRAKDLFVLLDSETLEKYPELTQVLACLLTSAAPTYLPQQSFEMEGETLWGEDGGLGANDPAFLVYSQEEHPHHHCLRKAKADHPEHDFVLVSIGTGESLLPPRPKDAGAIQFIKDGIGETMSAARAATELMLHMILGDDHYFRLQFESSEPLDTTDPNILEGIIKKAHAVSQTEPFAVLIEKLVEIIQGREKGTKSVL